MLKDSMERGVQTTGRVIGGLCAMAIVATLVVGVPLAMLLCRGEGDPDGVGLLASIISCDSCGGRAICETQVAGLAWQLCGPCVGGLETLFV